MNFSRIMLLVNGMTLAILLCLGGCSDPKKQAVKQVEAKGYGFTEKDMLVAAAAGDVPALEAFQAAGMNIDAADPAGFTALMMAAGSGRVDAVERVLGMGADPKKVNEAGRDALIFAAERGHEEVARMLLSRGADPSLRDKEGWSALSLSAYKGHSEVVALLSSTASPTELDDALLVASFSGYPKVLDVLLGQGANINARSPESQTPLMIASSAGKTDAVRVLLQNQANPYAVDLENHTAASLAQKAGHKQVVDLIGNPSSWGTSEQGKTVASEMADARSALRAAGVEETLLDGKPLSGEPNKGELVASGAKDSAKPSQSLPSGVSAPAANTDPQGKVATTTTSATTTPSTPTAGTVASASTAPQSSREQTTAPIAAPIAAVDAAPSTDSSSQKTEEVASAKSVGKSVGGQGKEVPAAKSVATGTQLTGSAKVDLASHADFRKVRQESKNKPLVPINGSTIHSRQLETAPVQEMVLAAYHEEALPIFVDGVDGHAASVRRLDQPGSSTVVQEGEVIPGTPYKVREVTQRFVSSKEGKGEMVDVSRVEVENTRNGATHYLVKDTAGQTSDTYAILTAINSRYRYVVKAGDVFQTTQGDTVTKEFQVLDVRANAVVIKDSETGEVTTVARDGVVTP